MENLQLSRDAILTILNEISINIPRHTKLKTDRLRHRLGRCLDAAQRYGSLFGEENAVVDPSKFPLWTREQGAVRQGLDRKIWGGMDPGISPGAFSAMCSSINVLGDQWDKGIREVVFTDQEATTIAIKIRKVHSVGENRPLLVVGFAVIAKTRKLGLKRSLKTLYAAAQHPEAPMFHSSSEEQALFLHVLGQNKLHLSPECSKQFSDGQYTASFILPTSWLPMEELGRLGRTSGCVVCGEPTKSECERCKSIQYCGKDCQKKHWGEHQYICRAVSSGTWHTFTLDPSPGGLMQGLSFKTHINRYDDLGDKPIIDDMRDTNTPPPNEYGEKHYLVKFQAALGSTSHIMAYDKRRSFTLFIRQDKNPNTFNEALRALSDWPKVYRWAQRVGDWEWRICFDQEPGVDPQW